MINANTPWADATRQGCSDLTTGFKYVVEYSELNNSRGDVMMFLRWATGEVTVHDRDGNYSARYAMVRNTRTGLVSKKRFGMHGSVKIA